MMLKDVNKVNAIEDLSNLEEVINPQDKYDTAEVWGQERDIDLDRYSRNRRLFYDLNSMRRGRDY